MKDDNEIKPDKSIDTIGLYCPVPLFRTREAIDTLKKGEILEVLADDPAAESDLKSFSKRTGNEIIKIKKDDGFLQFFIRKIK